MNIHVAVSQWMTDKLYKERRSLDNVFDVVERVFLISREQMKTKSRQGDIIEARHAFIYVAREVMKYPLISIGTEMGMDHTSIMSAVESFKGRLVSDYRGINRKMKALYHLAFEGETVGTFKL
jgi:chromosomal replication initiation ATPase DnaA